MKDLLEKYVGSINFVFDRFIYPISEFIKSYSETVGESLEQIFNIFSNIVILSPIFIFSIVLGLLVTGDTVDLIPRLLTILDTFVVSVMVFSSILVLIGSRIYYKSEKNALLTSVLLLVAGLSYYLSEPTNSYVILVGVLYGIGGYITTIIEFETPYNHYYVYEKLSPHNNILDLSITSGILLFFISLFAVYSPAWISSDIVTTSIVILTGVGSYLITYLQISHYKDIYRFIDLKIQSQFWILTPQVLVIVATGIYVFGSLNFLLYMGMILSPSIAGLIFSFYIENQVEGLSSDKKLTNSSSFYTYFSDSYHKTGKVPVKPHQNIEVDSNFDKSNDVASLSFKAEIEIPEKFPEEFSDMPWYQIALICDRIDQTSKLMKGASEKQKTEVNEFYTEVTERAIDELKNDGSLEEFNKIPDSFVDKIRHELYKIDDTDISDIHYFEVKSERPIKKKAKKYVESK